MFGKTLKWIAPITAAVALTAGAAWAEEGNGGDAEDRLIADFATDHQSTFDTWWYAFDGAYVGGDESETAVVVADGVATVTNGETAASNGMRSTLAVEFGEEKAPFNASDFEGISFRYMTTGTTAITFKVIDSYSSENENGHDWSFTLPAVDEMTAVEISFADLELPDWTPDEDDRTDAQMIFDSEDIVAIQFVIGGAEGDVFTIDDVWFRVAFDGDGPGEPGDGPGEPDEPGDVGLLIADFSEDHGSEFGTYWFGMDGEYGADTVVVAEESGFLVYTVTVIGDHDHSGTIALDLADPKAAFDASEFGGISLRYKMPAGMSVSLRLIDSYSDTVTNGGNFSYDLPATGGEWKEVMVLFSLFEVPSWYEGDGADRDLDLEDILAIQLATSGGEIGDELAIDDVWFRPADWTVSIAEIARDVPDNVHEVVVIAPIVIPGGEFLAGPSPAPRGGTVNFFWTGRTVTDGSVTIYDAQGNVVRRLALASSGADDRSVGSWDMKDARGRFVPEGTYLARGVITTPRGRERVNAVIGVAR